MARANRWDELFKAAQAAVKPKQGRPVTSAPQTKKLREKIKSLVIDNQFSKAMKALTSCGLLSADDSEVLEDLKSKHPQHLPYKRETPTQHKPSVFFTPEAIVEAVKGFPRTSAPGASMFRPSFLIDAFDHPAAGSFNRVAYPLAEVCNILVQGQAPPEIAPYVAGAPIFPLQKKPETKEIRPIAVGEVLRRLVSRATLYMRSGGSPWSAKTRLSLRLTSKMFLT